MTAKNFPEVSEEFGKIAGQLYGDVMFYDHEAVRSAIGDVLVCAALLKEKESRVAFAAMLHVCAKTIFDM